jgi:phosphoglycolate phosphatase
VKHLWLFDFDGVIADSLDVFERSVREALLSIGMDIIKDRRDFLALFDENLYASLDKKGLKMRDMYKLFSHIESHTDFASIRLHKGIRDAILKIKQLANIAIVSSNREAQIEKILTANSALGLFDTVAGVGAGRSKSKKIRALMKKFKAKVSDTYYVVDTKGDLTEARAAGIRVVGVGWGWHDLLSVGADHFVRAPEDLEKLAVTLCNS